MALAKVKEDPAARYAELQLGLYLNQFIRVSDLNKVVDFLNTLNTLTDAADDAAAATAGVPIGSLYRSTSTIKVRVA